MITGSLGSTVFYVSDGTVKTIKSMTWKKAYKYSEHKMHGRKSILEYTGQSPDDIELEIRASATLGISPLQMVQELDAMAAAHSVVKFILGTDVIGGDWVITDLQANPDAFFADGTMLSAPIKLKIKEYGTEA